MATIGVGVAWQVDEPSAQPLLDRLVFRPDDDNLCIWVSDRDPRRLILDFDVEAASYAEAIELGRGEVEAVMAAALSAGRVTDITAMDDVGGREWRAENEDRG